MQAQEPHNAVLGRPVSAARARVGSWSYLFSYDPLDTAPACVINTQAQITLGLLVNPLKGRQMKRHKMSKSHSKRDFRVKASKVHKRNALQPMRGGIRA